MKERVVFVDYIRAFACFLVMLVHASENFYAADSSGLAGSWSMLANEANRFWVSFYDGALGRVAVPLFMIVSAFLLVPMKPGETMMSFYKKRFMRIMPPFIFFMLLYTFLPLAWDGMSLEQSLTDLKLLPFNFPSMGGHLWFMYPLISLYLIIPVVSPWLEKASAKEERIFLGIFALSTFTPWIHRFITPEIWGECFWNGFSALWYCSGYLGYLVLAHYVRVHLNWSRDRKLLVGALCFIAGAAFTGWSFYLKGVPGVRIETPMLEWAWELCTPNVLLATFGLFIMFSCIGASGTVSASVCGAASATCSAAGMTSASADCGAVGAVPSGSSSAADCGRANKADGGAEAVCQPSDGAAVARPSGGCCRRCCRKLIADISKCSFGMYLMHMFFLSQIAAFFVNGNQAEPLIPVWAAIPVIAILTYICCYVTTKLLSLIPGSKYFIGC